MLPNLNSQPIKEMQLKETNIPKLMIYLKIINKIIFKGKMPTQINIRIKLRLIIN